MEDVWKKMLLNLDSFKMAKTTIYSFTRNASQRQCGGPGAENLYFLEGIG